MLHSIKDRTDTSGFSFFSSSRPCVWFLLLILFRSGKRCSLNCKFCVNKQKDYHELQEIPAAGREKYRITEAAE